MELAEATHMLMHALAEDSIQAELDQARSQLEVYHILCKIEYFNLTQDEFREAVTDLSQLQDEE